MTGVDIDNVRVEDALPSLNVFELDMTGGGGGLFANVSFRNVAARNVSTMRKTLDGRPLPFGLPNYMFGVEAGAFQNIAFENVTIAGESIARGFADAAKWNVSKRGTRTNVTIDGVPV